MGARCDALSKSGCGTLRIVYLVSPVPPLWEVLLGGGIPIHKMSLGEWRLDTYECDLDGSASDAGILVDSTSPSHRELLCLGG